MMDCISVENMRLSDALTIENHVPSLTLMHRAAWGVYLAGLQETGWQGRTAILCGSGNNGGDGFALACILARQGYACQVFTMSPRLSPDSSHYAAQAGQLGVQIGAFDPEKTPLKPFDRVVDCLLGTGFRGQPREDYRRAIAAINESGLPVISVDINSGMNGDTGEGEWVVRSRLTVTIGFVKRGLVTAGAGQHMQRLLCADIGIRLAKQEQTLLAPGEEITHPDTQLSAPAWLDTAILDATGA